MQSHLPFLASISCPIQRFVAPASVLKSVFYVPYSIFFFLVSFRSSIYFSYYNPRTAMVGPGIQAKIKIIAINQGLLISKGGKGLVFRAEIALCNSVFSAMLTTTFPSRFYYLSLIQQETESQRHQMACLRTQNIGYLSQDLNLALSNHESPLAMLLQVLFRLFIRHYGIRKLHCSHRFLFSTPTLVEIIRLRLNTGGRS